MTRWQHTQQAPERPVHPTTFRLIAWLALTALSPVALAQDPPDKSRGALLYETHCVSCHTTQMHWRTNRLATDWDSLEVQVKRWQGNAGLQWTDADVLAVTRHLNNTIYKYPPTGNRVGRNTHAD